MMRILKTFSDFGKKIANKAKIEVAALMRYITTMLKRKYPCIVMMISENLDRSVKHINI